MMIKRAGRKQIYLSFNPVNFCDASGKSRFSWFDRINSWFQLDSDTDVAGVKQQPETYFTVRNVPNPFNPETKIDIQLPAPGHVEIDVYNSRGQHVRPLYSGRMDRGIHRIKWDGRDRRGLDMSSGVYLLSIALETDNRVLQKTLKMIKLK
ncbi:MAG: FlgD immunoglobulin-like domain containing protein [candidate division KSB1 bacterium]|nr:FlgD immunoglobulin-like domain containing protein [candidate division KSB1 bacterium]